jgi:putative transposase
MSMSAAIAYRHDGQRARLFFQMRPGSYDTSTLIEFLEDLGREFKGDRVLLIWDGLPAHKSKDMKEYLHAQRHWLRAERLPAYSPDLNPVESLWGNIKGQELANRCVDELGERTAAARTGLERVRRRPPLLFGFLRHAGLSL